MFRKKEQRKKEIASNSLGGGGAIQTLRDHQIQGCHLHITLRKMLPDANTTFSRVALS